MSALSSEPSLQALHRERYPILERQVYLASHSLGAVSLEVQEALAQYGRDWAQLGLEAWEGPFWHAVEDFQRLLGSLLGWGPESVCPMLNATRGMAGLASCFDYSKPRRKILLTELEFTTSFPFWQGQVDLGAEIELVPSKDGRSIEPEELERRLDDTVLLVVLSHAFFRSGALCPDLGSLCQAARSVGARVLLDVYQTLGAVPVEASRWGVDAVVGGAHKWLCGGPGAGFLALAPDYLEELRPRLTGWFGLREPFAYALDLGRGEPHPSALRFLAGTPNVPALYAARPALQRIVELGPARIRTSSIAKTEYLRRRLEERWGEAGPVKVLSAADPSLRNGMLCLQVPDGKSAVASLTRQRIACDYRPECGIRISPHFYSSIDDLERLLAGLERAVRPT